MQKRQVCVKGYRQKDETVFLRSLWTEEEWEKIRRSDDERRAF